MVAGLRSQPKHTTSASKTHTKHGHWSEIATHTHKHTNSANKTRTKHGHWCEITTHTHKHTNSASKTHTKNSTGNATDNWVKMCTQLEL